MPISKEELELLPVVTVYYYGRDNLSYSVTGHQCNKNSASASIVVELQPLTDESRHIYPWTAIQRVVVSAEEIERFESLA